MRSRFVAGREGARDCRRDRVVVDLGRRWRVPQRSVGGVLARPAAREGAGVGGQHREHHAVEVVEVGDQSGAAGGAERVPGLAGGFQAGRPWVAASRWPPR